MSTTSTPRYRNVAVIGTGPSGISAIRALNEEKIFDNIRVFERRNQPGGLWHYDPEPDPFPGSTPNRAISGTTKAPTPKTTTNIPSNLPQFTPPAPEDLSARTAIYENLDSNVGAELMAFTHTPIPLVNSAVSVEKLGKQDNPTRPFRVVSRYLQDLVHDYLPLISFNTTVEKVEKKAIPNNQNSTGHGHYTEKWILTLRRSGQLLQNKPLDYWWQEEFDAVVVASGHYNEPLIPENITGLEEAAKSQPWVLEHSKAFRSVDNYVNKRVIVVGGSISAADLVSDLHLVVRGPLILSQRGDNEALESAWNLPNVSRKPAIKSITPTTNADADANDGSVNVTFTDNTTINNIDRIIFATGYRLSYPFLTPDPVTFSNRLAGFYQHIFKIGDPSLAIVGQVRGALSFRVYEYQAIAVARYFANREATPLPSPTEQEKWETKRIEYKGTSSLFHEIKPDFKDYFTFLKRFSGLPHPLSHSYELPDFHDSWPAKGFAILELKDAYWKSKQKFAGLVSNGSGTPKL